MELNGIDEGIVKAEDFHTPCTGKKPRPEAVLTPIGANTGAVAVTCRLLPQSVRFKPNPPAVVDDITAPTQYCPGVALTFIGTVNSRTPVTLL